MLESSSVAEVMENRNGDLVLLQFKGAIHQQKDEVFSQGGDCLLHYRVANLFLIWVTLKIKSLRKL